MFKRLFMTVSVLAAGVASGATTDPCSWPAGINAPARIEPKGEWGVYTDVSFLYWQAMQQNMELGVVATSTNGVAQVSLLDVGNPGQVINTDFDYHPGFKVGLGMNFDHDRWDALAEYTWFQGTTFQLVDVRQNLGQLLFPFALHPGFIPSGGNAFTGMSESWNLKMDFVDATLGRWCWVGDSLALHPFFGARGAWIRQKALYGFVNTRQRTADAVFETSRSWGIGPSLGLNADWLLGHGIRFFGTASADLLYTWYTLHIDEAEFTNVTFSNLSSSEDLRMNFDSMLEVTWLESIFLPLGEGFSGGTLSDQLNLTQKHIAYLQPHANLELGFGWGSYFSDDRWHFDLSASYGFQVFWDQNMFRHFDDNNITSNSTLSNGNLYVHGLTATARFDY